MGEEELISIVGGGIGNRDFHPMSFQSLENVRSLEGDRMGVILG